MLKLALIGEKISQSLSPKLMNFFADKMGVKLDYSLVDLCGDCTDQELLSSIEKFDGVNITSPFKIRVGEMLCNSPVNLVLNKKGKFTSCSVDGFGVVLSLSSFDLDVQGKNLLIFGAGGSAYSAAGALSAEGAKIKIINRTKSKADKIVQQLNLQSFDGNVDGILSFLPDGIYPDSLTDDTVSEAEFCFDANYKQPSPLLDKAKKYGVRAIDGVTMLYYQGVASFELFTGKTLPLEKIDLWYKEFYNEIVNN